MNENATMTMTNLVYTDKIIFLSLPSTIEFSVSTSDIQKLEDFRVDLFTPFLKVGSDDESPIILSLQRNTLEIRDKIGSTIRKYSKFIPSINRLNTFFKQLQENQPFYFLPMVNLSQLDKVRLYLQLEALEQNKEFKELLNQKFDYFADLLSNYEIFTYGKVRLNIGEQIKAKRVCRFCNQSIPTVSFSKRAHAISEGLGNKKLILFNECDECNELFSKIETDIIEYLALFRTFYTVPAKKGPKQLQGKNFKIDTKHEISIFDSQIGEKITMPFTLRLEGNKQVSAQNIYKCLCKYFISLIPEDHLKYFEETIAWIVGDATKLKLPKIAEKVSYERFSLEPQMHVYLRISENIQLPFAVGELYFTCYVFTFIVPMNSEDKIDFTDPVNYQYFWSNFKNKNQPEDWSYNDFSDSKGRLLNRNINLKLGNQV